MSRYRVTTGSGSDVALLHGWGLHGGVFESLASSLAAQRRVHVLDLPGHGRSPWSKGAADHAGLARLAARPAHAPFLSQRIAVESLINSFLAET